LTLTHVQPGPFDHGSAAPIPILDDDKAGMDKDDGWILSEEKHELKLNLKIKEILKSCWFFKWSRICLFVFVRGLTALYTLNIKMSVLFWNFAWGFNVTKNHKIISCFAFWVILDHPVVSMHWALAQGKGGGGVPE
jgi:hypothetical protein